MTQLVTDEKGTIHRFPDEATPQMIAEALGVSYGEPAGNSYRPVDTSPLPAPRKPPSYRPRGAGDFIAQNQMYEAHRRAALGGVTENAPQEAGRYELGYALDPQAPSSLEFIDRAISRERNAGVPPPERESAGVRVGPMTGETEYYDPQSRRYALYNPLKLDKGDLKSAAVPAGQLGIEAIATAAGAALGPQGAALGGAGSAALTEYIRLKIGKSMGLNAEMSDKDITLHALTVGGLTGVGGEAMLGLQSAFKAVDNMIAGRVFTKETLANLKPNMAGAADTVRRLQGLSPDAKLKLNLAQQTGDPNLLQAANTFLKTPGPKQAGMIADREAQQNAVEAARRGINQPVGPSVSAFNAGEAIQGPVQAVQEAAQGAQATLMRAGQQRAQEAVGAIPEGSQTAAGSSVAGQMVDEKQGFKTWANEQAGLVDLAAGSTPIGNANLSRLANTFSAEERQAIFPQLQGDKRGLVGRAPGAGSTDPMAPITGAEPKPGALNPVFDPNTKWTFQQAWDAVSTLKRLARKAGKDPSTMGPNEATYTRAYQALEADIAAAFKNNPEAKAVYDQFRAQYRSQKAILDNTRQEALNTQPDKVFKSIWGSADREANDEVAYFIAGNPQAMQRWRGAIFDDYRQSVLKNGRVEPALHDAWMRKYGEMARPYFSNADYQLLRNANTSEQTFLRVQQQAKDVEESIKKSFGGKLTSLEPAKVYGYLWGKNKIGEIRKFMGVAGDEQINALKQAALKDQDTVLYKTDPMTNRKVLSHANVDKYINEHEDEIAELFGKKYLSDLKVVRDALKYTQQTPPTGNMSESGLISGEANKFLNSKLGQIFSMWAGPLSHTRYAIRRALTLKGSIAEEVIYNAIRDPDSLSKLVELRYLNPKSKRAAAILGDLGGLSLSEATE